MHSVIVTDDPLCGGRTVCLYLYLRMYLKLYLCIYLYSYLYLCLFFVCICIASWLPTTCCLAVARSQNIDGAILGDRIWPGKDLDQDHCHRLMGFWCWLFGDLQAGLNIQTTIRLYILYMLCHHHHSTQGMVVFVMDKQTVRSVFQHTYMSWIIRSKRKLRVLFLERGCWQKILKADDRAF